MTRYTTSDLRKNENSLERFFRTVNMKSFIFITSVVFILLLVIANSAANPAYVPLV